MQLLRDLQGLLDTPGGEERVVLKRVKARVQVCEHNSGPQA